MYPSDWVFDCCGDTSELSEHYVYPRSSANSLDTSPIIIIDDFVMSGCPGGNYYSCSMEGLKEVTPSQFMNILTKHLDKNGEVWRFISLKKVGSVKLSNFASDVPIYQGVVLHTN